MTLRDAIHWQPGAGTRPAVILAGIGLTLVLAYLHFIAGLAYEFHIFFSVPVLCVTWYAGAVAGYGIGSLAVLLWLVTDRMLGGDQLAVFPLLFNGASHLALTFGGVWLLAQLRHALQRERRLARTDALTGMVCASAGRYVEELRQRLLAAMDEADWPVTFSIGVANYPTAPADLDTVLAVADGLMYEAKHGGRDRIVSKTCR